MRPTYTEIDLSAIRHNVRQFVSLIGPSKVCSVVKADGYGHGDVPVAHAALEAGASLLAVALVEEGIRLREGGIQSQIIVLSEADADSVADLASWELTPTVYSIEGVERLAEVGGGGVHVKIDTGMHRVGVSPRSLHDLVTRARALNLTVEGIWTHFSVADEDPEFTNRQISIFEETTAGWDIPLSHMANTAGAVLFPESRRDLCRVGLGTYGLHPCPETWDQVDLHPAMRLITHVSHTQRLEAGSRPSYGRRRPLAHESTVVTAPIGYADGFGRQMSQYGCALIGGKRFPLAGTVTMDQIVIDVGDADVHRGDEVVLLGNQGTDAINADEWAEVMGTISYEVVCGIGPRVPRRYIK